MLIKKVIASLNPENIIAEEEPKSLKDGENKEKELKDDGQVESKSTN